MTADEFFDNRDREDVRSLLKTKWGLRFVARLIKRSAPLTSPYTGDRDSTHLMIGQQELGRYLIATVLDVNPEALSEFQKIYKEDEHVRNKLEQQHGNNEYPAE